MNKTHAHYSTQKLSLPIWQVWHGNDSRLKTLGPSALFIPLRANMYNYKSKCAEGNHVNTNKGFLVAKLISCK